MVQKSQFADIIVACEFVEVNPDRQMLDLNAKLNPPLPRRTGWLRGIPRTRKRFTPFFVTNQYETKFMDELGRYWIGLPAGSHKLRSRQILDYSPPAPAMVLAPVRKKPRIKPKTRRPNPKKAKKRKKKIKKK